MGGGQLSGGAIQNPGRPADVPTAGGARGADVRFVNKVIVLGGAIGHRSQVDELIATLTALRPMLQNDDAKADDGVA